MLILLAEAHASGPPQAPPSFKNIQIAAANQRGSAPCEPSIAVSQKDPNHIVAGVILDRAIATADGGKSWTDMTLKSQWGVFGDPALIADSSGNFYFIHLATRRGIAHLDRIVCHKSTDGGKTWNDGAGIGNNPPTQQDKAWAACHPTKPIMAVTWTQFDRYAEKNPHFHSNIMISASSDGGITWSKALRINEISGECLDDSGTTEGAVPAIDRQGRFLVAWSNQGIVWFQRSLDNGKTWLKHDIPAAKQYGGWDMAIPGLGRSNGMPVLMVDNSKGPHSGNLYVVFADKRNGENDSDVFLIRSTDHGDTWSKPLRINQDPAGKQQFLPWLAVDPATGYLYVVYYDRRAYDDLQTDVYLAFSTNGGVSFKETKISESPFTPTDRRFFGDYNNISAYKGVIAPVWTRMDNGATSVWTAVIKQEELVRK
ncbi:MAG: glycosyl hydrolase [Fimbriimonadales bacterium]